MVSKQLTRRDALRIAGAGAVGSQFASAQGRRPNLVILYADDMGWRDVSFNGRKEWSTPNLDRLGAQGTIFNRWYTGMPLCAPSRACLLTGKYTIHHGVRNNSTDIPAGETTIAEALKPLGYATGLFGKWHRGRLPDGSFTHPLDMGFDQTFGYLDARHAWEHFPKRLFRGRDEVPVEGFSSDLLVDEAIKFVTKHRSQPFFLYVPFIEPHFLIEAPEEDVAKFRGKFKEKNLKEPLNATYAAMIHRLDRSVGRLLKTLDDNNLTKDTLVFFSSDNGATFETGNKGTANALDSNHPFRGQKRSLEEGGIRVPGLARWPGRIPAGRRSDVPMHMTDIFPTFLAAAGGRADPAWQVDGLNLVDVWTGKAAPPERTLFWEFQTENRSMMAAMRGDHKLLDIGGQQFLYNVAEDPGERRTLFQEYPEIFKQLQGELKAWMATAR